MWGMEGTRRLCTFCSVCCDPKTALSLFFFKGEVGSPFLFPLGERDKLG